MKSKPTEAQTDLLTTLAAARKTKGLSQAALAASLGMPQPQISRVERGLNAPQLDTLQNLAGALDLQLMLVPRALGPVVRALVTDFASGSRSPAEPPAEERPLYRIQAEESADSGTRSGAHAGRIDVIE
jgi:transcriptional regulator with XRE-family HTH domain